MTTYRVRVTEKRESGNLIAWQGIDVDAAAFEPTGTAAPVNPSTQVVRTPGVTHAVAADLPPLLESDFGCTGYYGAGAPLTAAGWPGAAIYRLPDGGSTYAPEITLRTAAVIGGAISVLGTHGFPGFTDERYRGYYSDHVNTVDVALTNGTLSSCTYAEFMNLQNVALLGNEIIAFKEATLISTGVYRLSVLLRGLQGTEWFARLNPASQIANTVQMSDGTVLEFHASTVEGHRVGDVFLLLTPSVHRFIPSSATTPIGGRVRGITTGAALDSASDVYMPQTWASIVPPHPSHLRAWKSGTDELTVDFAPRGYVGGAWESGHDVPIPADQQYLITTGAASHFVTGEPPFVIVDPQFTAWAAEHGNVLDIRVAAVARQFPSSVTPVFNQSGGWRVNGNPALIRYASPLRHFTPITRVAF